MHPKIIVLSLRSYTKKSAFVWFHLYKILENANECIVIESKSVVMGMNGEVREVWEGWIKKGMRKLLGEMDMFTIMITTMVSPVYTYVTTYQTVHFK